MRKSIVVVTHALNSTGVRKQFLDMSKNDSETNGTAAYGVRGYGDRDDEQFPARIQRVVISQRLGTKLMRRIPTEEMQDDVSPDLPYGSAIRPVPFSHLSLSLPRKNCWVNSRHGRTSASPMVSRD